MYAQTQNLRREKSCINFEDFWIVFWSPTDWFQSRAPGKILFQGLSSGEMAPLDESFQGLCLGYFQHEAHEFLRKIIPSFREMCTLRSSSHSLRSKGVPHTIWPKLSNLSNIQAWFEKVLRRLWKIVFWSPTECFQSRAPDEITFQGWALERWTV